MSILSETKPVDGRRLPARFDLQHAVAFSFHDALASLVVALERAKALSVPVQLEGQDTAELAALKGEELFTWLRENGYQDVIADLCYRQLTAAVLSDACQFICESLLASGKGKTTVAFALLRKPFKENLLLLEWLLADPAGFVARYNGEADGGYLLNRISPAFRRSIISTAVGIAGAGALDENLISLIRYDKESPNSLETLWTKATHLVTSVKASTTEIGNLNFVFSGESAIDEQWEQYYRIVPLLLYYFTKVADAVVVRFVQWDPTLYPTFRMLRDLAYVRLSEATLPSVQVARPQSSLAELLAELSFTCLKCTQQQVVKAEHVDHLWLRHELICTGCGHQSLIWDLTEQRD